MAEGPNTHIYIDSATDGFAVTVQPPPSDQSFDQTFPTHRAARGWAGGIRLSRGGTIIDRTYGTDAPAQQRG